VRNVMTIGLVSFALCVIAFVTFQAKLPSQRIITLVFGVIVIYNIVRTMRESEE
jgi:hypothetical protein